MLTHYVGPEKLIAGRFDRFFQKYFVPAEFDVAQAFVFVCQRAVSGFRSGGKPAFVNAATVCSERIEISRVQL
jgi:hypothetical protein